MIMNKMLFVIGLLTATHFAIAQQTVRIEITILPAYHPAGSAVYLAGSFNGWNPQDEKYRFKKDDKGGYYLDLQLAAGSYEYKVTRGGWDKVECNKDGSTRANRSLTVPAITPVAITIEEWDDRFPVAPKVSSASRNVQVIDTVFLIPQLKRTRRVWVYLPEFYKSEQGRRYPVLYMHDGQNVFDNATSFSGEWGVDEFLDSTTLKKCIVVAVDHGGAKRLNEYNPYDNDRFGKGEGSAYVDFLVKTLKPYIDNRYRTLSDQPHTFVAGSSMGGLISLYAILKYPDTFGGAGVFSPAFWIAGPRIFDDVKAKGDKINGRVYFYGGNLEGETMVPDMLKVYELLHSVSKADLITVVNEEGRHNEPTWRKQFPLFYEWMMK